MTQPKGGRPSVFPEWPPGRDRPTEEWMRQVEGMIIPYWDWPPKDGVGGKRGLPSEWAERQRERTRMADNRINAGAPALAQMKGEISDLRNWVHGLQAYREVLDHEVAELTEWLTGRTEDGSPLPTGRESMRKALADLRERLDRLESRLDAPGESRPPVEKAGNNGP